MQALARGDANDVGVLRQFAEAILAAEPAAAGAAVSYYESARTVTRAFVEAGVMALVAIAILLAITLRRITDVLLTLIPLLLPVRSRWSFPSCLARSSISRILSRFRCYSASE